MFTSTVLVALPLWAHGEQLIFLPFGVLILFPAALLLFIPWHRRWAARLTAVAVLVLATLLLSFMPRLEGRAMSSVEQWLLLFSPSLCAAIFAAAVRRTSRKRAA